MHTVALCQVKASLMTHSDIFPVGSFADLANPVNISMAAALFPVQIPLSSVITAM